MLSASLFAQEAGPHYRYSKAIWLGYFNSTAFNSKWSLNTDIQFRGKDWLAQPSQALVRSGLGYKLAEKVRVTIGLAHYRFYLNDIVTRGEWRPWQEVLLNNDIGKVKIAHRLRAEQRFNETVLNAHPTGDYTFNWRFRYRLDVQIPLFTKNEKSIWLVLGDELLINAGKNIKYNYFDQNRIYLGFNFEQNKRITYQIQVMQISQQQSNGTTLDKISVIRVNVFHKIVL